MSDEQEPASGESTRSTDERCSRRPSAARPTSCWTPAPQDELGPMRHSAAHVMAEAVLDLFPGTKLGIGPAIDDGFYYDFELPRPLTPDDLAGDRGADAREHRRRPPVRAQRAAAGRGAARSSSSAASRSRSRSSTTSLAAAERDGTPMPPTTFYRQGPFIDLCRGPHVASTGKIGPFKLLGDRRRVLARRREAPDAPAHLRHGLGDPGGARPVPVAARGGEEARPPPARRPARPVQLPRRLAGLGVLAPEGPADLAHARGRHARAPGAARLPGDQHADPRRRSGCGSQSGHWDLYDDNMFLVESEDQLFSLKPMNCPESRRSSTGRHLRSYRDLPLRFSEYGRLHRNERSGTLCGLTRVRQFIQDDAHIYVRPDQLTDEIEALLGEVREAYGVGRADAALRVRDEAGQGASATRRSGSGPSSSSARPSTAAGVSYDAQAQGRHVLRAQDRHLHRRRARARVADGDHPGRPRRCCPSAST